MAIGIFFLAVILVIFVMPDPADFFLSFHIFHAIGD